MFKRAFFILIFGTLFIFTMGWVVMALWNYVCPPVLHTGELTYWQALALLALCKILFGGFRGRPGGGGFMRRGRFGSHKWKNMTEEEKERLRARWKREDQQSCM
jgi:hypothetical protein